MKKIAYWGLLETLTVPLLVGCSTRKTTSPSTSLSTQKQNDTKKLNKTITELKKELNSETNIEWISKTTTGVSNADISNGIMIEFYPKNNSDSRIVEKWYAPEQNTKQLRLLRTTLSKAAKLLTDDNTELSLGFESLQNGKGVVPIARSIKSMDAIPIN